ncbi:hypothetical protein, partial [Streptomyces termitum]|uniref:hypothetical protein n=1 Tax=Streptomyces termitum TaxID=67368 RepID=UPI0033BEB73C
ERTYPRGLRRRDHTSHCKIISSLASSYGTTSTGKASHSYGHLPWMATDVALLTHGRSAGGMTAVLDALEAFDTWSVHDRYLDGSDVVEADVLQRRTVAKDILALHEQALITGRL